MLKDVIVGKNFYMSVKFLYLVKTGATLGVREKSMTEHFSIFAKTMGKLVKEASIVPAP